MFFLLVSTSLPVQASKSEIVVQDDLGREVRLTSAAMRVISLAPHLTEQIFAVGGGDQLVAVMAYSDYPEAAKALPRIGNAMGLDIERLLTMRPDLIVAWHSGNPLFQVEQLQALGLPVFFSETEMLADVARSMRALGALLGQDEQAELAASQYENALRNLQRQYRLAPKLSVFYQLWSHPLMTVNGSHLIGQSIALCGGDNIFSKVSIKVPSVSHESVIARQPEVILTTGETELNSILADMDSMIKEPVRVQRVTDMLSRPGPRMLAGIAQVCESLQSVRQLLKKTAPEMGGER